MATDYLKAESVEKGVEQAFVKMRIVLTHQVLEGGINTDIG